jgi:FkbM family methyltransferase
LKKDIFEFKSLLLEEIVSTLPNDFGPENWDHEVLPYPESWGQRFLSLIPKKLCAAWGYLLLGKKDLSKVIRLLKNKQPILGYAYLYSRLGNVASKKLLVQIVAHRELGHKKAKLPLNKAAYWKMRKSISKMICGTEKIRLNFREFILKKYDLRSLGFPIRLNHMPGGVAIAFILKQYEYKKKNTIIQAKKNDIVIDAGGCWGDTGLYFAHQVGPVGKVYMFEFLPENLAVIRKNFALNEKLAGRVQVETAALWDKSRSKVNYTSNGPASRLENTQGKEVTCSVSIDDFVKKKGLGRVDFIKMDIEGAELKALIGAKNTLCKWRPQLAIALYHADDHFEKIPRFLESLSLGYRFYLDHFTVFRSETMLFATT